MHRSPSLFWLTLCPLLALSACSRPAEPQGATSPPAAVASAPLPAVDPALADAAEQAVPQFHLAYMGADYAGMYRNAASGFRLLEAEHDFVARMSAIRRKMGEIKGAERISAAAQGELVTLRYNSTYANGPAVEEFVVQSDGKSAALLSYRLVSPPLF